MLWWEEGFCQMLARAGGLWSVTTTAILGGEALLGPDHPIRRPRGRGPVLDDDRLDLTDSGRQVLWAFGFAGLGASAEPGRRPPPFLGGVHPYHGIPAAAGRNPRQRFSPI